MCRKFNAIGSCAFIRMKTNVQDLEIIVLYISITHVIHV